MTLARARPGPCVVLPMGGHDLDAVTRIAAACFRVPWPRQAFAGELTRPHAVLRVLRPARGRPVCAFATAWCVPGELEIHNVATLPDMRSRGYGRQLTLALLEAGRAAGAGVARLELRVSNSTARRLYEGVGFRPAGVRHRYYSDNGEDALLMRLELSCVR